jgi:hypothetical protein
MPFIVRCVLGEWPKVGEKAKMSKKKISAFKELVFLRFLVLGNFIAFTSGKNNQVISYTFTCFVSL